ncbi:hypothetical protein HRR83_007002 [Exophiala dermatitidis]|nr:hypothetical protein HRR73_006041 [Exophiala dermatitidis]KAJ4568117.1 hypothetical protein HRR82_008022 [Exophiala dermatitidis]KAJ4579975.1 hypothetical protein HRR81_002138 [Exophiala dermatitidis]KAJ4592444.1 hypothetical protein HRR83_007002 [Exophiala dermatitidis]KAJ4611361.1 hypothetical protein HRR85_005186 [Exophiala dermatitidis]
MRVLIKMKKEHQDANHSGYSHSGWVGMSTAYSSSPQPTLSPMHEFPGFDYHTTTPMPMEPSYIVSRPSPFAASHAQMPPPLIMPHNALWPSMLASQPQHTYHTPIIPSGTLQTPLSASTGSDVTPTSAKTTTSRRKLTDDERRQMCIEAEQNPTMKQTQIGAKFNVERSTVSKILRQRDKYMNPQVKDESSSPTKKSRAKLPDFEKTLSNWVKNQQNKGLSITDDDLRKKAQVFSFSRNDQAVVSSVAWLEKFKRKHRLGASQADEDEAVMDSQTTSLTETPINESPTSSSGLVSPSMTAIDEKANNSGIKMENAQSLFDFEENTPFEQPSKQGDGLVNEISQAGGVATLLLPNSREVSDGGPDDMTFVASAHEPTEALNHQRRQTFSHTPTVGSGSRPSSSSQMGPSLPVRSLTNSTVESQQDAIDPRQMMKRHKSVPDIHYPGQVLSSSMQPPPLPRSADTSPVSHPASPVDDENIRALHAIKTLLEQNPNVAEPDDYLAIGKLMEKLKLLRPNGGSLPGGMHPIDIMDSPRISKKRTILGIST